MPIGPPEIAICLLLLLIPFFGLLLRMLLRGGKQQQQQQQQQVVVVQSNPVNPSSENTGNVIHNVTYNIHDSAITGDIKTGLNEKKL